MPRIEIDLSKFRLYLFEGNKLIKQYPVGVGKVATQTPTGHYTIINKDPYPFSYPGGPLSPFGVLWMGLSRPHYGIHGTNRPASIGTRASKGCVRMYNKDVLDLSSRVPIGTSVLIYE